MLLFSEATGTGGIFKTFTAKCVILNDMRDSSHQDLYAGVVTRRVDDLETYTGSLPASSRAGHHLPTQPWSTTLEHTYVHAPKLSKQEISVVYPVERTLEFEARQLPPPHLVPSEPMGHPPLVEEPAVVQFSGKTCLRFKVTRTRKCWQG